jgi:hypothetical protein
MNGKPKGALLVWMDIESGHEEDFDHWYNRQHLFERIAVPGFLTGRRWQAVSGTPQFLATYETAALETLQGEEYLRRLENPTPWTLRVMPRFRNTIRGVCAITARCGSGTGGCIATLRLSPAAAQREPLRHWASDQGLPHSVKLPGIMSAYVCESIQSGASRARTAEQELRREPDRNIDWVILIEGTSEAAVEDAAGRLRLAAEQSAGIANWGADGGVYRFLCGVVPSDAGLE